MCFWSAGWCCSLCLPGIAWFDQQLFLEGSSWTYVAVLNFVQHRWVGLNFQIVSLLALVL